MEITLENIKKVQENNMWGFGNQILYDMCKRAPLHINEDEIVGKILTYGQLIAI